MDSSIIDIIHELRETASTNDKTKLLKLHKDNELLKQVFYLANDPNIIFGIKKIPTYNHTNMMYTLSDIVYDMLPKIYNKVLSGTSAIRYLTDILSNTTIENSDIVECIIRKDLRCSVGKRNTNKVWPGLLSTTAYMGASVYNEKKVDDLFKKGVVYSELKMDGRYLNTIVTGLNSYKMLSRNGKPNNLFDVFKNSLNKIFLKNKNIPFVLNGELVMSGIGRFESNGIIASIVSIGDNIDSSDYEERVEKFGIKHNMTLDEALEKIEYVVWDIVSIDVFENSKLYKASDKALEKLIGNDFTVEDYKEQIKLNANNKSVSNRTYRLNKLSSLVDETLNNIKLIDYKIVANKQEAFKHFASCLSAGEEGTILKSEHNIWADGKPSTQVKFKLEMDCDLIVKRKNFGDSTGKYKDMIGSVDCESSDGLLKVSANVLGDSERERLVSEDIENTIVTVRCNGISSSNGVYSMMYPRIVSFRDDKDEADSLQDIKNIESMKLNLENVISE